MACNSLYGCPTCGRGCSNSCSSSTTEWGECVCTEDVPGNGACDIYDPINTPIRGGRTTPIVPLGGDIFPRKSMGPGPIRDRELLDGGLSAFDGGAVTKNWVPLVILGLSLVVGIAISEWGTKKLIK